MPGAPAVEAKDEFIEVGLEVFAAQPVIDAQGPDLEVGEDPVDPRQDDVRGHLADDMGIMGEASGSGISGPTIGLGSGTGREIGGEKGMKAGGRIIGDLAEADAAGTAAAVLDLNGAEDQHFALMTASAPLVTGPFLLRQTISVSSTSTRPASELRSGASIARPTTTRSSSSRCNS